MKTWQETGRLRLSDWASPNLVLQLWLGRLFCLGGFSHAALRLSTIFLAAVSIGMFHSLLTVSGAGRRAAGLATACLAINPLFLNLSLTYMTDVPFLAVCLLALRLFSAGASVWSCGWAIAAACLIRQPGWLLSVGLAWVLSKRGSLTRDKIIVLVLPAALVLGLHALWLHGLHGPTWARLKYNMVDTLVHVLYVPLFIKDAVLRGGWCALYLGMAVLPLTLPELFLEKERGSLGRNLRELGPGNRLFWWFLLLLCAGMALWRFPSVDGLLSERGIGMATPYIRRAKSGGFLESRIFWLILGAASAASWGVLSLRFLSVREGAVRWAAAACAPLLIWVFAGSHFSDRYLMVFIPGALAAVSTMKIRRSSWLLALMLGGYSLAGTIDDHRWHQAFWNGCRALRSRGVPAESIWGLFEWIAWHNYQPEMDRLKAEKPLYRISDREWLERVLERRSGLVSFTADRPEDFEPAGELDYFSPLSMRREKVYLSLRM